MPPSHLGPTYFQKKGVSIQIDMSKTFIESLASELKQSLAFGFCVDIGAPRSVVGPKTLNCILTANGTYQRRILPSSDRFRFADATYDSLGTVVAPLFTLP